ncbi:STAS-domain containing protein [compost metagenome]
MAVQTALSEDGRELTIAIKGRFDFAKHQPFRDAYEHLPPKTYFIDLREATYLDSSALGMLLMLRDHGGGDAADVRLINCSSDVRKILAIANFESLFQIQG